MANLRSRRCTALLILACFLLPLVLSCSGEKGTEADRASANDGKVSPSHTAIDEATEAIHRDPKGVNERGELAYARRGRAYAEMGEYDKALADYTEAIRLYPAIRGPYFSARLTEARIGRAQCYAKKGEYDKAITDYTDLIQSTPTVSKTIGEALMNGGILAVAYYRRGVCYDAKGEHGKARDDYTKALQLAPDLANSTDVKQRLRK